MLLPLRLNLDRVRFNGTNPSAGTRQDEEDFLAVLLCAMPILNRQRVGTRSLSRSSSRVRVPSLRRPFLGD